MPEPACNQRHKNDSGETMPGESSLPQASPFPSPPEPRFTRSRDIVDQAALNSHPVAIVGVGAIGSHLAGMLAWLGVTRLTLIDPDVVSEVNLGVQGFFEDELGLAKVHAAESRLRRIRSAVQVAAHVESWVAGSSLIPPGAVVFATPDSISVRRALFEEAMVRGRAPCLLDGRMSAEALEAWCVPRNIPAVLRAYRASFFPRSQAHREPCTARATVYCAAMAAGALCAMFKRWVMHETAGFWHSRLELSLRTFDLVHAELEVN